MCRKNSRTTGTGTVPPEERNRIDSEEKKVIYTVTEFIKRGYAVNEKGQLGMEAERRCRGFYICDAVFS